MSIEGPRRAGLSRFGRSSCSEHSGLFDRVQSARSPLSRRHLPSHSPAPRLSGQSSVVRLPPRSGEQNAPKIPTLRIPPNMNTPDQHASSPLPDHEARTWLPPPPSKFYAQPDVTQHSDLLPSNASRSKPAGSAHLIIRAAAGGRRHARSLQCVDARPRWILASSSCLGEMHVLTQPCKLPRSLPERLLCTECYELGCSSSRSTSHHSPLEH